MYRQQWLSQVNLNPKFSLIQKIVCNLWLELMVFMLQYYNLRFELRSNAGDPTKKRRVERSRKMAEAKERTQTPTTSPDMQSTLKRCENLEKEVRSLKLNLAFMNRKDSEQTKQIEELEKQNEELGDEKYRLLEEINRILSQQDKM